MSHRLATRNFFTNRANGNGRPAWQVTVLATPGRTWKKLSDQRASTPSSSSQVHNAGFSAVSEVACDGFTPLAQIQPHQ